MLDRWSNGHVEELLEVEVEPVGELGRLYAPARLSEELPGQVRLSYSIPPPASSEE